MSDDKPVSDPYWPGDHRAGDHFTARQLAHTLLQIEAEWMGPAAAALPSLAELDLPRWARESEASGTPVLPLLQQLRAHLPPQLQPRLHAGLTSQDVMDSALMRMAAQAQATVWAHLAQIAASLRELAVEFAEADMVARTLSQPAVPTTFGYRAAVWLAGVLDAAEVASALEFPVQIGGAAGTQAAVVELGHPVPSQPPWHTTRAPITQIANAWATTTAALGHIANDIIQQVRPEVGELRLRGGGASSTMPHKSNPVLAILVRRAAWLSPQLLASLQLAASLQLEDRADGAWHLEWAPLRTLARATIVAAAQTHELLDSLEPDVEAMARNFAAAQPGIWAERDRIRAELGRRVDTGWRGTITDYITTQTQRSDHLFQELE